MLDLDNKIDHSPFIIPKAKGNLFSWVDNFVQAKNQEVSVRVRNDPH